MREPVISFLRDRLTIGQLQVLETHHLVRLLLATGMEANVPANRWGTVFGVTVCAACEPAWTEAQHRSEWAGYGEIMLREIPRWVERWPCRHLLALAASFPDGDEWRDWLQHRVVRTTLDQRRYE